MSEHDSDHAGAEHMGAVRSHEDQADADAEAAADVTERLGGGE